MKIAKTRRRRRALGRLGRLFGARVLGAGHVDVRFAPPAPRYEVVPAPRVGYVWAPGYWDYRHNRYHWVAGNWVRERPGYYYSSPTWVQHGDRWRSTLVRGWPKRRRDRDDGIPNRRRRCPTATTATATATAYRNITTAVRTTRTATDRAARAGPRSPCPA